MTGPRSLLRRVQGRLARPPTAPAAPAAPRPFAGVGRFVSRVAPARPADVEVVDQEVDDPFQAAAVRAGWLLVDAYERLSPTGASRVLGHEDAAWLRYAEEHLPPLRQEEDARSGTVSRTNRLRYRRMVDLARPGDRVLDVGHGAGHLAVHLVRDAGVERYVGIDLETRLQDSARRLFALNGVPAEVVEIEQGDLYDLTRERLESLDVTLVICCEVLEHVPDAERALEVLAQALPPGVDLVFSVPLAGRLEGIWGHVSVFDVARLKAMLDRAGLHTHHVEPLANTWAIVLASADPAPSLRAREAGGRPPTRVSSPLVRARDFVDLPSAAWSGADVEPQDDGWVRVTLPPGAEVSAPVGGLEALRCWFEVLDGGPATMRITATAGDVTTASWSWRALKGDDPTGLKRLALRPGWSTPRVTAGSHRKLTSSDRIHVIPDASARGPVTVRLRAAYLP